MEPVSTLRPQVVRQQGKKEVDEAIRRQCLKQSAVREDTSLGEEISQGSTADLKRLHAKKEEMSNTMSKTIVDICDPSKKVEMKLADLFSHAEQAVEAFETFSGVSNYDEELTVSLKFKVDEVIECKKRSEKTILEDEVSGYQKSSRSKPISPDVSLGCAESSSLNSYKVKGISEVLNETELSTRLCELSKVLAARQALTDQMGKHNENFVATKKKHKEILKNMEVEIAGLEKVKGELNQNLLISNENCRTQLCALGKYQFVSRWQMSCLSPCVECCSMQGGRQKYIEVGTIGNGSFGSVLMVRKIGTDNLYAMKMISKEYTIIKEQVRHTVQERRVMSAVSSPFLVKLESHFQTRRNLCLVMELVRGGELFAHLRDVGRFDENKARFYVREIVVSLEYLHSLGLVYRDLKPENILLDETGHVKITDFGFSSILSPSTPRMTLCGTPEYLAPEVILGQGQCEGVDWWALGILVHEMCAGRPPFTCLKNDEEDTQLEIYEKIISNNVKFPPFFSLELRDMIDKLLCRYEVNRLGVLESVRKHKWLKDTDWNKVERKKTVPPYIPGDLSQSWLRRGESTIDQEEMYIFDHDDPFVDF